MEYTEEWSHSREKHLYFYINCCPKFIFESIPNDDPEGTSETRRMLSRKEGPELED
jgi:hypothetical protein